MNNPSVPAGSGNEPPIQGSGPSSDSVQGEYLQTRAAVQRGNDNWIRALAQGAGDPQAAQAQPASPQSPKGGATGSQAPKPSGANVSRGTSGSNPDQSAEGQGDVSFSELMENWPSQMALGHKILSAGWAASKDITRGLTEAPKQVIGGALDAFNNLSSFAAKTAAEADKAGLPDIRFQLLNDKGEWDPRTITPEELSAHPFRVPTTGGAQSVTGNIVRTGTNFLMGRGTSGSAMGALTGPGGNILRSFISGSVAMDPNQERLSNVIEKVAPNFLTKWLEADPKDEGKLLGHLKSGLEYAGLDTAFAGAKNGLEWLKGVMPQEPTMADHLGTMETAADAMQAGRQNNVASIGEKIQTPPWQQAPPGSASESQVPGIMIGGRPLDAVQTVALSRADKLPDAPYLVFDTRNKNGYEGVFPTEDQAKSFIADHPEGGHLDYGTPRSIENLNPTGEESEANTATGLRAKITEAVNKLSTSNDNPLPEDSPEFANAKTITQRASPTPADIFNSIKPEEGQQTSFLPGKAPDDLVKLDPDIKAKAADYLANKTGANPAWVNLDRIQSADDVKEALARVATQLPEIPEQSNETTKWIANSLGIQPEDLIAGYKGQNINAAETTAMRLMLDSSAQQLVEHASAARTAESSPDAQAQFLKAYATHSALQQYAMNARAEAGRTLQSWSIMAGEGSQYTKAIQNIINGVGESDIKTMASQISDLADPLLVNKYLSNTRTMTGRDAILYGYNNLLLSNPKTVIKKLASDTGMAMWNLATRYAAERSPLGTSGEIPDGETGQLAYGYMSSMKDGIKLAGRALKTGERQFLPYNTMDFADTSDRLSTLTENSPETMEPETPTKNFGEVMKMFMPTRWIGAADDFAKYTNYRAELRGLAYRSGVSKGLAQNTEEMAGHISDLMDTPSADLHQQAVSAALRNTFQEPLDGIAKKFQEVMDGMNLPIMHTDMQVPVGRILMPFIKVPFNIMKFAYRNSPAAALFPSSALSDELSAGGATRDLALSKMALGTALSLSMADLAMSGTITGKGPSQYDAQAAWRRAGNQPYSMKVGDKAYGYNNIEPFGLMMGTIADTFETMRYAPDDHDAERAATSLAFGLGNAFLSKTYMQGMSNFFDALENPEADSKYYTENLLSSFTVPQGVAGIEKAVDPWRRAHYGILDDIASRTPGLSQNLPPARNLWGDPIPQTQGFMPPLSGTGLARMLSPVSVADATGGEPIDKWAWENRAVFPHWDKGRMGLDAPSRTFSWSQNRLTASVMLNPVQYDRLRVLAGNGLKDGNGLGAKDSLNAIVSGNFPDQAKQQWWNDASPAARAMYVVSVWNAYSGAARKAMMNEDPNLKSQIEQGLQQRVDMLQGAGATVQ